MRSTIYCLIFFCLLLSSCTEFNRVLKNPDIQARYEYAKKYFNNKQYGKSATLLEDIVPFFRGTTNGEEALYLLAKSYYEQKDYTTASSYFNTYFNTYPKGQYAELARFYSAYGLYKNSPDPRLDQGDTYKAIKELQAFLEIYPDSERKEEVQSLLFDLQEKLAYKQLLDVRLYYNLGDYVVGYPFPGGNYTSCVITADNAIRDYPYSKYREEFMIYTLKAKYEMAVMSVDEKKSLRYRDVVDEYYSYVNEFPQGKFLKEAKKIFEESSKKAGSNS